MMRKASRWLEMVTLTGHDSTWAALRGVQFWVLEGGVSVEMAFRGDFGVELTSGQRRDERTNGEGGEELQECRTLAGHCKGVVMLMVVGRSIFWEGAQAAMARWDYACLVQVLDRVARTCL